MGEAGGENMEMDSIQKVAGAEQESQERREAAAAESRRSEDGSKVQSGCRDILIFKNEEKLLLDTRSVKSNGKSTSGM